MSFGVKRRREKCHGEKCQVGRNVLHPVRKYEWPCVLYNELLHKSCIVATITYCVIIFIAHQINDYTCSKNRTYFQFHVHKKIDSRLTKTHQGSTTHLTLIVCICFQTTASTCLKWYVLNKIASISIKLLFPLTQYVLESNLKPSTT